MKRMTSGKKKQTGLRMAPGTDTEESRARYRDAVEEYNHTVPHDFGRDGYEDAALAEYTPRRTTAEAAVEEGHADFITQNMPQEIPPAKSSKSAYSTASTSRYRPPSEAHHPGSYYQSMDEPEMVDATYEEYYGEAYLGAPIKYIYPTGYQSMRPRGGPWKLSIVVFVLFTWLSIFIVGHCSDRIEYDYNQYGNNEIDDDALVIETRWCGSKLLYILWVMSMTITGLAAAYCSVIGYIKVRDFTVGNCRSQPPGMVGKSDYYVRVRDSGASNGRPPSPSNSDATYRSYQKSIYQSDGTPQFWGGHIYRPTQAAVAVTSR